MLKEHSKYKLAVILRSLDGIVYNNETAHLCTIPGAAGEFGVMGGHMDYYAGVRKGVIRVDNDKIPCNAGFARIITKNGTHTLCEVLI